MPILEQKTERLGQEMVQRGLLKTEDLVDALRIRKQENRPLSEVLVDTGLVRREEVLAVLGAVLNLPVVDLKRQRIEPAVLKYIPETLARRYLALPVELRGNTLLVAMGEPEDLRAQELLQARAGVRIQPAVVDLEQLDAAIDLYYKATSQIEEHIQDYRGVELEVEGTPTRLADSLAQTPVVRTLDLLLVQAIRDRASDVHIEPQPDRVRVRYRIDGVLREAVSLPMTIHAPLLSRIKILAQMNIAERRLPQDGQFTFKTADKAVDIRVATIETAHGERAVLRLLDKGPSLLNLSELGFSPESLSQYRSMLRVPHGMVLASGPTGSGKTTTLYASINAMDYQATNILTIEDPIEYHFTGINQIQVNPKAGLTFASGLRALMRHDPDVVLVGEVRDSDTARTAVQGALTGHVVLSSIHANDAEGVVHRLVHLGIEPFLIASALVGVIAQRMVRRVCPNCAIRREASVEEQLAFERAMNGRQTEFMYGKGCQFCVNTGYRGRTGIFEVMPMSETLRRLILANAEPGALQKQAMKEGMITLLRDGFIKAKEGITTPVEVLRNLYSIG